ncbi:MULTISPECIES: PepSY-associated TM helix domain-containing protein [unclassified Acinetobacter]|uniref:PepSY-associated TM helix domain-containing protein n=1 Tax=unclassified Acinetobacter TaxID=196816 RepID=UPI0035B846BE
MMKSDNSTYFTLWRWHFYAGMFVAPFLMLLAATGLAMILFANITGKDLDRTTVAVQANTQPIEQQAQNALHALDSMGDVSNAKVVQYIAPRSADTVALFRVKAEQHGEKLDQFVLIDPYTAQVVQHFPRQSNWYHTFDNIHGDILLGKTGDYLLETAASLTILLIVTGVYLWWHRRQSVKAMLIPTQNESGKRSLWRVIHATLGSWVAIILLFFCITGLAWAGIWGEKMVQAWNQFPAGKWGVEPMPQSVIANAQPQDTPVQPHVHGTENDSTHVASVTHGEVLNDGKHKEVPWTLEQTAMPMSNTEQKQPVVPTLSSIQQQAQSLGFVGRYQINQPKGETGVWTISQDSMSYDMPSPTADRTVHIDQYSGAILADIHFTDYNLMGKFMAAGIALHMGTLGWWSVTANVLFCLSVILMCIAGYIMWWQRRPSQGLKSLNPPASGKAIKLSIPFAVILLILSALFPTALIAILVIALLDWLLIKRLALLQKLIQS